MSDKIAGQEVTICGIKAQLPPGAERFVVSNTCGRGLAFRFEVAPQTVYYFWMLDEYDAWMPSAREGFAHIMESLWGEQMQNQAHPNIVRALFQKVQWTAIIQAVKEAG